MTKLMVVTGGTGKQGGSVINAFLKDPTFTIRAITRDTSSKVAKNLEARGVEVVQGDINDKASLEKAFKGAKYIYAMTGDIGVNGSALLAKNDGSVVVEEAYRIEKAAGKNIVDAARSALDSLDLFIFSTLSACNKLSNGRYKNVYHFDAKAEVVEYLEHTYPELVDKTVALQLGMFATNIMLPTPLRPTKQSDGRFKIMMPCSAKTSVPFIDPNHDPAIFVKALATKPLPPTRPKSGSGGPTVRQFAGVGKYTTFAEWTKLLNARLPFEVYFEEVDLKTWADTIGWIPGLGLELGEMWQYVETVGYMGGDKGGAIPITDLELDEPPITMKEYIEKADWTFLTSEV